MDHQEKRRHDSQTIARLPSIAYVLITQSDSQFNEMTNPQKIIIYISFIFFLCSFGSGTFPGAEITNGIVHAGFYLPDKDVGYYRGTRFDWSGVMPVLEYKGHSYCGQWFPKYEPTLHDATMGPVEAFTPLGYDSANPSESFVLIGVGRLLKKDNQPYSPFRYYEITDGGDWKTEIQKDRIIFRQQIRGSGFAYDYKKTCTLIKGKPDLVLAHTLKNTGQQVIETNVFDHNFLSIDQQTTGPDFEIIFPFSLVDKKEGQGLNPLAGINGQRIQFTRAFQKNEIVYTVLEGYNSTPADYLIKMENHRTGAAVSITADRPLSKLVFWACSTAICPEPYLHLKIKPGDSVSWNLSYHFYSCHIKS